jgi:hypothetical protein
MAFLTWLEASPVSTWVNQSDSVFAYPMVLFIHTVGLTLLVGINLAVNLRTVGFAPQIPAGDLQKLYPVMWTGLALSVVSGALLLAAKATTMGVNPAFYVKMACVGAAVAIVFGVGARNKALAVVSIVLWFGAITAGRFMAYVGEAAQFG